MSIGGVHRIALVVFLAALSLGCQSGRSWQQGCPGVYSGVKYYGDQVGELPIDGKLFFSIDLPLTVVVDTLALPFTAFAEPKKPTGGFPIGCRWAQRRRNR
jgi:uncharacterized protein YceK